MKKSPKEHIFVDKKHANSIERLKVNQSESSSSSGEAFFSALSSIYEFVDSREDSWKSSSKSLSDQLDELNEYSKNHVVWKEEQTKIIPKTLSLAKIVKSSFQNGLKFERIKRVVVDTKLKKNFRLGYADGNLINLKSTSDVEKCITSVF